MFCPRFPSHHDGIGTVRHDPLRRRPKTNCQILIHFSLSHTLSVLSLSSSLPIPIYLCVFIYISIVSYPADDRVIGLRPLASFGNRARGLLNVYRVPPKDKSSTIITISIYVFVLYYWHEISNQVSNVISIMHIYNNRSLFDPHNCQTVVET